MTVVVTGASGHIGANLVRELLARGRSVRAVIHTNKGLVEGLPIEFVPGDVRDPDSLRAAFQGAETVLHLAAVISIDGDKDGMVPAVNVVGAGNVADAALQAGVRRMVHVSSVHAFNQAPLDQELDETRERATAPHHNAYDRSKANGETQVRNAIEQGLDCVIVHPTGVIGPWDAEPSRMGEVFLKLFHRSLPALSDGGFNWVDARDVTAGILAAEERGRCGQNYLLAGHYRTVLQMAELAESITGVPRPRMVTPMWLARVGAPFQRGWDHLNGRRALYTAESLEALRANTRISWKKAHDELGYTPRPVEQSVYDVYEWFRAHGQIPSDAQLRAPQLPT
jgi:dihydroflavonol-4-reductase